jgi:hypothetical protein
MGYISRWLKKCRYNMHMDPSNGRGAGLVETPGGYKWRAGFEDTPAPPPGSINTGVGNYRMTSLEIGFPKPLLFGLLRKIKII